MATLLSFQNSANKKARESIFSPSIEAPLELSSRVIDLNMPELTDKWRKLQTSDHFYYMCTKWFADGDVHAYFSPYDSPYDAFIYYMNALKNFESEIRDLTQTAELNAAHSEI